MAATGDQYKGTIPFPPFPSLLQLLEATRIAHLVALCIIFKASSTASAFSLPGSHTPASLREPWRLCWARIIWNNLSALRSLIITAKFPFSTQGKKSPMCRKESKIIPSSGIHDSADPHAETHITTNSTSRSHLWGQGPTSESEHGSDTVLQRPDWINF